MKSRSNSLCRRAVGPLVSCVLAMVATQGIVRGEFRHALVIGNAAYKEVKTFNASDLRRYIRLSCTAETGAASSAVTCVGYGTRKYEV
jgi:hypothetical protein